MLAWCRAMICNLISKWENSFQLARLTMARLDGNLAKPGRRMVVE